MSSILSIIVEEVLYRVSFPWYSFDHFLQYNQTSRVSQITSFQWEDIQMTKESERERTCANIPPTMAQAGGNSIVPLISLSKRLSGTWLSLTDCRINIQFLSELWVTFIKNWKHKTKETLTLASQSFFLNSKTVARSSSEHSPCLRPSLSSNTSTTEIVTPKITVFECIYLF